MNALEEAGVYVASKIEPRVGERAGIVEEEFRREVKALTAAWARINDEALQAHGDVAGAIHAFGETLRLAPDEDQKRSAEKHIRTLTGKPQTGGSLLSPPPQRHAPAKSPPLSPGSSVPL